MSFKQWVTDHVDGINPALTDTQRAIRYLKRYPNEPVLTALPYLFNYYKQSLEERSVRRLLYKRLEKLSTRQVGELYRSLDPNLFKEHIIVYILSKGCPIMFWKYFNPIGISIGFEHVNELFERLNRTQRSKYAEDALRISGYLLRYLTPRQRTKKRCMIAVQTNGAALHIVPKSKRSDEIVRAAISRSASAMQYASKTQRIEYIELAVMGPGQKWDHHRIGGFSPEDWERPWAIEVFKVIGKNRRNELYKRWEEQRKKDANDWHNDHASI